VLVRTSINSMHAGWKENGHVTKTIRFSKDNLNHDGKGMPRDATMPITWKNWGAGGGKGRGGAGVGLV
jgi:hypothetical protein